MDSSLSSEDDEPDESRRRMMLDALEQNPSAWTQLDPRFRNDKEFVLTVLRKAKQLPSKVDFERSFPQSLRFDKDIVLAFCAREDFPELYKERHLYVPACWTNNKDVMLAYCRKIPRSLQECTEELCDDREVVEAAIALDGLELQYASNRLQEDTDLVRAACLKDGRALEFCPPGHARSELTSDRDFMLSVVGQHGGAMLRLVGDPLRTDRELVLEALAHGMHLRFCPFEYQTDQAFLTEVLRRNAQLYLELNKPAQMNLDLATAAIISETTNPTVQERALHHCPALKANRQVLLAIANRGNAETMKQIFQGPHAEPFKDDKEVVLAALQKEPLLFTYVSNRLRLDVDVIIAAMTEATAIDVLRTVPSEMQEAHVEIAVKAIQVVPHHRMRYVRVYVRPATVWQDRNVAIAWIRRGNPVMESMQPLLADESIAMELAQYNPFEFSRVAAPLRADRDFMLRAVKVNGRVLRYAAPELQKSDMELLVEAVANTPDATWSGPLSRFAVTKYVEDKLKLYNTFMCEFLRGIAISTPHVPPARRSQLPLLDRGVETSQAFKRIIAEFLGVPCGATLHKMRAAQTNLSLPQSTSITRDPLGDEIPALLNRRMARVRRDRARFAAFDFMMDDNDDFADGWGGIPRLAVRIMGRPALADRLVALAPRRAQAQAVEGVAALPRQEPVLQPPPPPPIDVLGDDLLFEDDDWLPEIFPFPPRLENNDNEADDDDDDIPALVMRHLGPMARHMPPPHMNP